MRKLKRKYWILCSDGDEASLVRDQAHLDFSQDKCICTVHRNFASTGSLKEQNGNIDWPNSMACAFAAEAGRYFHFLYYEYE